MPALEIIERALGLGPIRSFRGVLNGTTNFVLDRLAGGQDLKSAVSAAQEAGYAEANCVAFALAVRAATNLTHRRLLTI